MYFLQKPPSASPCGHPCRSPRPGRLRPGAPAYPQGSASSSGCASSTAPRRHLRQLLPTCASTCCERLWGGGRRPRELLEGVLRPRGRLQRRKQEGHREEAGTQTSCPRGEGVAAPRLSPARLFGPRARTTRLSDLRPRRRTP